MSDGKIEAVYVGPGAVQIGDRVVRSGDTVRVGADEAKDSDYYKPVRGGGKNKDD